MLRRFFLLAAFFLIGMPVLAHSNVLAIEPDVTKTFASTPPEIRMIFTEPLEAEFSQMDVYDNHGELVPLPPAIVPEREPISLVLDTSSLATGVYTVAWRVVSATDGHPSEGSFLLRIGSNAATISAVMPQSTAIDSKELRAFNLLSLALLMGAAAFPLLIWKNAEILKHYFVFAWLMLGLSGLTLALMQAAIVTGSWGDAFGAIPSLLMGTRFGLLWFARMGLWLILGIFALRKGSLQTTDKTTQESPVGAQYIAPKNPVINLIAMPSVNTIQLLFVLALLLIQSLMSHASGALDAWGAIAVDWLHLVAMGLWLGGLVAFFLVLGSLRKQVQVLSEIIARFSNLARLSVLMLTITGMYSAWLHVGSFEALFNTAYGQALIVKLLLFVPLLGLGAVNLLLTSRGLRAGEFVWSKRLRWLLGTEIALCVGILAAVGSMTSVEPARTAYQAPAQLENTAFFEMALSDGMMVHLTIEPNIAGENRFYVDLLNEDMSAPINDATSVSLNFGDSPVEAVFQGGGHYVLSGDLNQAGEAAISVSIERPNQSSTNLDFHPIVNSAHESDPLAPASRQQRAIALLLTGLSSLGISLYLLSRSFPQKLIFASAALIATGIISVAGLTLFMPQSVSSDAPIKMVTGAERPYLITASGAILQPSASGYEVLPLDAHANDLYRQTNGTLWVATDSGLYRDEDGLWTLESDIPAHDLISAHGFIMALGDGAIYRIEEGNLLTDRRSLEIPLDAPANDFVMMGNHSYVLLNGDAVYSTSSVGLGWTPLDAPIAIEHIGADENGNILAMGEGSFWTWNWASGAWTAREGLPIGVSDWELFNGELYFLAEGRVYKGSQSIELSGNFIDITYQYPDSLWLLEDNGSLWRRRLTSDIWEQE